MKRSFTRRSFPLLVLLQLLVFLAAVSPSRAATWNIKAEPARLVNGGPVLFRVKTPSNIKALRGSWLGHSIDFSFNPSTKTWFALAGISLETAPGSYDLELAGEASTKATSTQSSESKKFKVAKASYPKIAAKLNVESKFTAPSEGQQKEIAESQQVKKDFLGRVTPEREWSGTFIAPADASISDVFGSVRVFNNGKSSSPHLGLDFRVPTGTPVRAMNDGTVLLARLLYFEGNFVVIDHGQGLLTLYLHLSEFKVKEGDSVKRGQVIGLSGGTGRATGPHLHAAVRWEGTYLDPAKLIALPLPELNR